MNFHPPGTQLVQFEIISYPVFNDTTIDYICLDHERACPALLKTLRPELLQSQAARDYFTGNGTAWVELGAHPHIVRCYAVIQPDDTGASYLVLQAVVPEKEYDTASLRSFLDSNQPLPVLQALLFTMQIARGMQHVIDKIPGFVHGDLKLESILVSGGRLPRAGINRLRITDFGLATLLKMEGVQLSAGLETTKTTVERTQLINGVVGTPLYMAPEQWCEERTSTATDIYMLGCLLYKMLSGRNLVEGETIEALKNAHCTGNRNSLPAYLPEGISYLINNCLALNPEERYQSWEELETVVAETYESATNYPIPAIELTDTLTASERELGGWFLNEMGRAAIEAGNVTASITCYELAIKAGQSEGDWALVGTATNNLGEAYRQLGDSREAISQHEKALIIGYEISNKSIVAFALNGKGIAYLQQGNPNLAFQHLEQALTIARKNDDEQNEMIVLGNMGAVHHQLGDPRRAFQYYEQELKIARQISNRRLESVALTNMGAIYLDMGNNHSAIKCQEQSLAIMYEIGDIHGQSASLNNLANAYRNLGHTQQAFEYYNMALEITRWMGDRRGEAFALNNMGSTYSNLGDMQRALEYHEQALKIFKQIGDKRSQGDCLTNMGYIYMNRRDTKRAIEISMQALAIDREIGDMMGVAFDSFNMANLLAQQGLFSDALPYAEETAAILDKVGLTAKAVEAHQLVAALRLKINC